VSLGKVAELKNGYAFKSQQYAASGPYRVITISNVQDGRLDSATCKYLDRTPDDLKEFQMLEAGDMLISMTGNVGRVCKVLESGFLLNQRVGKIIPISIDNDFLYSVLSSDSFREEMIELAQGGAQPNLSVGDILDYAFECPSSLAEQRKIAEILRTWDEAIETAEAELKAKQERKRWMMENLMKPSAEGAGALRMNCWDVYKIGELCDVITGSTPSRTNSEYWNEGSVPWFTVDDIRKGGRVIYNTIQHVTDKAVKESSLRLMPADTVLLCCTASVGEYAITRVPITSNQQFNGLVIKSEFKDKLSADFFFNVASTLKEKLKAFCGKTSVDFVSGSNLKSIQITLPPLAEQRKIAKVMEHADADIELIDKRMEAFRTQKRGLMQKLLTGEVRVAA
jgi:restriction endonuclease S subunit